MRPGYRTSEHAVTWAVIGLAAVALFKGHGSIDALAAVVAPAIASAAYSASRGQVKSPPPLADTADADTADADTATADAQRLRRTLGAMFRGRLVK